MIGELELEGSPRCTTDLMSVLNETGRCAGRNSQVVFAVFRREARKLVRSLRDGRLYQGETRGKSCRYLRSGRRVAAGNFLRARARPVTQTTLEPGRVGPRDNNRRRSDCPSSRTCVNQGLGGRDFKGRRQVVSEGRFDDQSPGATLPTEIAGKRPEIMARMVGAGKLIPPRFLHYSPCIYNVLIIRSCACKRRARHAQLQHAAP